MSRVFQMIKQILILGSYNTTKPIQTYLALCEKVISPQVINHIFLKVEFSFTTQAWLLLLLL